MNSVTTLMTSYNTAGATGAYAFSAMLGALVCLHSYWMVLVLKMGKTAAMGKGVADTYQRPVAEGEKQK
jgi:hypothetical protein